MILRSLTRTTQPQGIVGVNRRFSNIEAAIPSVQLGALNAANGTQVSALGGSPQVKVGISGIGTTYPSTASQYMTLASPLGQSFTLVVQVRDAVASAYGIFIDLDQFVQRDFQFRVTSGNQFEFIRFNTGGSPFFATGGTATGKDQVVIAVSNGTAIALYVDGVLAASTAMTGTPTTLTSNVLILGAGYGSAASFPSTSTSYNYTGLLYSASAISRAISSSEVASLSANPWQLFAPQQPSNVWVSLATGTVVTVARPSADTSVGTWSASSGSNLWSMLNENLYNDTNYISTASIGTCEIALNATAFPGTSNQTIAYRASSLTGNGINVTLKQGPTIIANWSHGLTTADILYTQTLTAPQIASITAAALSITLTST